MSSKESPDKKPKGPLSEAAIKNAKPGLKPRKLSDEKGLFLLLQPSGGKLWRMKYRVDGREKKLGLGRYPEISLKEARRKRDEARVQLAQGLDPGEERKRLLSESHSEALNTFQAVADEYLDKVAVEGREAVTIKKSRWLVSLLAPSIGNRPVSQITPKELLDALKPLEAAGHYETARRARSLSGRIFRYAIATSRAEHDPSSALRGALIAPKVRHHPAILDPLGVGKLMRAIQGFEGQPLIKLALDLSAHVFVRPGELRAAEWPEFDLEGAVWVIPAEKMKMRKPQRVPLSRQAIAILHRAHALSGGQKYVFSSLYPGTRPMSENTINSALRRLGYAGSEMTAHGFRAMASTLLNESGLWSSDAIERALAHDTSSSVRGNYHRGEHWDERKRMAQWWSDHLDKLRAKEI